MALAALGDVTRERQTARRLRRSATARVAGTGSSGWPGRTPAAHVTASVQRSCLRSAAGSHWHVVHGCGRAPRLDRQRGQPRGHGWVESGNPGSPRHRMPAATARRPGVSAQIGGCETRACRHPESGFTFNLQHAALLPLIHINRGTSVLLGWTLPDGGLKPDFPALWTVRSDKNLVQSSWLAAPGSLNRWNRVDLVGGDRGAVCGAGKGGKRLTNPIHYAPHSFPLARYHPCSGQQVESARDHQA